MKIFLVLFFILTSPSGTANEPTLSDGRKIVCAYDAYNCPSDRGTGKELANCGDVQLVWSTCKNNIHGLDGNDKDGHPCEEQCPNIKPYKRINK